MPGARLSGALTGARVSGVLTGARMPGAPPETWVSRRSGQSHNLAIRQQFPARSL